MNPPIRDVETLLAAMEAGARPKYLCFWSHQARPGMPPGRECLSQWYPAAFTLDAVEYPTAEHYMMAEKARLFGDEESRARILAAPHPDAAKRLGRAVGAFDEAVWDAHRFAIVVRGNAAKFGQNAALKAFLLATGERVLVEASPVDRVWGIGLAADDPRAEQPAQWNGLNLLGFALMDVREQLRR